MLLNLLQAAVNGILLSCIFATMGLGLNLIYGLLKIVNVAQISYAIFAAYLSYFLYRSYGIDPFFSLIFIIPITFVLGVLNYLFIEKLRIPQSQTLVALLSLLFIAVSLMTEVWSADFRYNPPEYSLYKIQIGDLIIRYPLLISLIIALGATVLLALLLDMTSLGIKIRAAAENPDAAKLTGINVSNVFMITYGLGTSLAGVAGVIVTLLYSFYPFLQIEWLGRLFALVILGGMGRTFGPLAGAVVLGVSEAITIQFTSPVWAEMVAYTLLIIVLFLRPKGILGER